MNKLKVYDKHSKSAILFRKRYWKVIMPQPEHIKIVIEPDGFVYGKWGKINCVILGRAWIR